MLALACLAWLVGFKSASGLNSEGVQLDMGKTATLEPERQLVEVSKMSELGEFLHFEAAT